MDDLTGIVVSAESPGGLHGMAKPDGDLLDLLAAGRLFRRVLQTSALSELKDMLQSRTVGEEELELWDFLHKSLSEVGGLIKAHKHARIAQAQRSAVTINDLPDHVLLRAFEYLGGSQSTRGQINALMLVSRRWRSLAELDELWLPICRDLWPVLAQAPPPRSQPCAGGQTTYRGVCKYRGRCLFNPGLLIVTPRWTTRYWLLFSMADQADGLTLFSGEGPMAYQEWHNHQEHRTILRLGAPGARVVTTPFSAASRDPVRRRFVDVRDFFSRSHLEDCPSSLTIRVAAIDTQSGREALLYESGKRTDRHVQDAAQGWPVPVSSLAVTDHAGTWVGSRGGGGACVAPMRSLFDFTIVPTPNQPADTHPQERLYQVHSEQVDPPTNTITHQGIVGLVFLGHVHEVGLLLSSLHWV